MDLLFFKYLWDFRNSLIRIDTTIGCLSWAPIHSKQMIDIKQLFVNIAPVGSTIGSTIADDKKVHD